MYRVENDIVRDVPISLYYQLKEDLLAKITSRKWLPGENIPSEKELCRMYGVSRTTVRKALEELEHAGYLTRQQGKGTFVTHISMEHRLSKFYSFSEEVKQRGREEYVRIISFEQIAATREVALRLRLEPLGRIFKLTRLRFVDQMAYALETSYIPENVCPGLTAEGVSSRGLYDSMRANGVFPNRAIEKFRATVIRKNEAELMELKTGAPAMHLERVTYFGTRTVEYCSSIVRGDFFTYTLELK